MPPAPRQVGITVAVEHGTALITLAGEFDRTTALDLAAGLDDAMARHPDQVVYDLSAVTYLDTATAHTLIMASEYRPHGRSPVLRHPSSLVLRLLRVTGLDRHCQIEPLWP